MLVGSLQKNPPELQCKSPEWLDQLQAEWVVVDQEGQVVGNEAEDSEMNLKPGQVNALAFS